MNDDTAPNGPSSRRSIVAFDFDGTLTTRDSFAGFLRWRTDPWRWALGLLRLAPSMLAYVATRDRGELKSACVRVFLGGLSRAQLNEQTGRFAASTFERIMRPDALVAWRAHQAQGDHLVIVTASPEEIVRPFADRLGADDLIGSRLAWSVDGRILGHLDGANCRGPEKVRRLCALYGPDLEITDAYGDTAGDTEMLARARRPHLGTFDGRG